MADPIPGRRLAGFFFWYYAALGVLVPFVGLYLSARGLTPAQIGFGIGGLAVTRVLAPYLWGWAADRSGRRMGIVLLTLGSGLLGFGLLGLVSNPLLLIAMLMLYGILVNGTLSQFEVVTFSHLGAQPQRYAQIRLWGSVGFLAAVLALGPLLEQWGVATLPVWVIGFFLLAWLTGWSIPEVSPLPRALQATGIGEMLRRPEVIALLVCCFLAQLSYGPYYVFFSIYLDGHGYGKNAIGLLWALGVAAEITMFWLAPRFMPRLSLVSMLTWAQAMTALRWILTVWLVDHPAMLAGVQLLHALSFGFYHLAAVSLFQRIFPPDLHGRAQGLHTSIGYGAGGAVGGFAAGALWETWPQEWIWYAAAGVAMLSGLIAGRLAVILRRNERRSLA